MRANLFRILVLGLLLSNACSKSAPKAEVVARIELARAGDGTINIIGQNLPSSAVAAQFELQVQSEESYVITETRPPSDLPLDSVAAEQAGRNRARFFLGDKRGIKLRQNGILASFSLLRTSSGEKNGRIRIEALKVADSKGGLVVVESGPSLFVR